MRKIFTVFVLLMLLCSCSTTNSIDHINSESEIIPEISEEIPEQYREIDFGEFSVLICDDSFSECAPMESVTVENKKFIADDSESKRVIAELLSVEDIADNNNPFAVYDEKYSSSVNTVEISFNNYAAKKYHIQTQLDEDFPVLTNNIFYCIRIDDKIVTFAYYPVMGYGGLHTEDIETVLNSIKAN